MSQRDWMGLDPPGAAKAGIQPSFMQGEIEIVISAKARINSVLF
ncbi:MAG: hypothetical protein ABJA62_05535 [Luteimonas sp.]